MGADVTSFPLKVDLTFGWIDQTKQHFCKSGLSAAGFSDNGNNFAAAEIEIDMIDRYCFLMPKTKYFGKFHSLQA